MATLERIPLGLEGAAIEWQPYIGNEAGGVLHLLPGGVDNPEGFGPSLRDIYAFTALGKGVVRGGHYHLALEELFIPMSGTGLWILSDFRETSSTRGQTSAFVLSTEWMESPFPVPLFSLMEKRVPRVRVPAGVYHAITPLTDSRLMTVAIGSTPYDGNDYRYPKPHEVPDMVEWLKKAGVELPAS